MACILPNTHDKYKADVTKLTGDKYAAAFTDKLVKKALESELTRQYIKQGMDSEEAAVKSIISAYMYSKQTADIFSRSFYPADVKAELERKIRDVKVDSPLGVKQLMKEIDDSLVTENMVNGATEQIDSFDEDLSANMKLSNALVNRLEEKGIKVVVGDSKGLNDKLKQLEKPEMMANKKSPSKRGSQYLNTLSLPASKKDTANVQKDLKSVSEKYKNQKSSKGFLTDLSDALGIDKKNASEYVKFTAKDGTEFTVRVSNHNANADHFEDNGELNGNISVVVKNKRSKNTFKANDNVELTEYVYFKEDIAKSDANVLSQIAESLSKTVEDGTYTDTTGLARVNTSPSNQQQNTELMTTSDGTVYGFTHNGKIYINGDRINPNTLIHEFTHLWCKIVKERNPKLWNNIKQLLRNDKLALALGKELRGNAIYEKLDSDAMLSEIIARFSGKNGRARLEKIQKELNGETKGLFEKFIDAIKEFWSWVGKNILQIESFSSIDEITDRVLYDLVKAKEEGKTEQAITKNSKGNITSISSKKLNGMTFKSNYKASDGLFSTMQITSDNEVFNGVDFYAQRDICRFLFVNQRQF